MNMMPPGKTVIEITTAVNQTMFDIGDVGYIDGYVQAADYRAYAVVVRRKDGYINLVPIRSLRGQNG